MTMTTIPIPILMDLLTTLTLDRTKACTRRLAGKLSLDTTALPPVQVLTTVTRWADGVAEEAGAAEAVAVEVEAVEEAVVVDSVACARLTILIDTAVLTTTVLTTTVLTTRSTVAGSLWRSRSVRSGR